MAGGQNTEGVGGAEAREEPGEGTVGAENGEGEGGDQEGEGDAGGDDAGGDEGNGEGGQGTTCADLLPCQGDDECRGGLSPPPRRVTINDAFHPEDQGWSAVNGGWSYDGAALVVSPGAGGPRVPAITKSQETMDPQAGWTRLSFTVDGAADGQWFGTVVLHRNLNSIAGLPGGFAPFQGMSIWPFQDRYVVYRGGAVFGDGRDGIDTPVPDGIRLTVILTCRGPLGHEVFIGAADHSSQVAHTVSWEAGCSPPPDAPHDARLMLMGPRGVGFDDVRYEQLPCNPLNEEDLRASDGECGRIARWPLSEMAGEIEDIFGGEPTHRPDDVRFDVRGDRWGMFLDGEGGA